MKKMVLVLALSLSALSAKANLDVTTCNSALLARLNEMTSLTKEERKAIEHVNSIMYYKISTLRTLSEQIKPQSDIVIKEAELARKKGAIDGLADTAMASGKLVAYTEVLRTIKADIDNLSACYNRTNQLLYGKK